MLIDRQRPKRNPFQNQIFCGVFKFSCRRICLDIYRVGGTMGADEDEFGSQPAVAELHFLA